MMLYNSTTSSKKHTVILLSFVAVLVILIAPRPVEAASYNLTADKESFARGDTFNVDVKIDSTDVGVNAAQATITFPKDTVQVTNVDKSSSTFDFWLQGPSYANDTGQVAFIGGSQSGISGKALEVLRITFKVNGTGPVGIIFSDGAITASDGSGTNVLTSMNGLQLMSVTSQEVTVIKPPQIVRPVVAAIKLPIKPVVNVPLYPDSATWYEETSKFIAQWDLPREVTEVATAIDQQPVFDPTTSEGLFNNKMFSPIYDGIWYLHVRFKNTAGWGPTTHYRIGIDSAPPLSFTVTSPDGLTTANVAPTILFGTKDQPSGISHYVVLIDNTVATTTTQGKYTLLPQRPGNHTLVVQAIDVAGNKTESRVNLDILETPLITIAGIGITKNFFFTSIILAIIVGGMLGWYAGRKQREQRLRRLIIAQRDVQTSFDLIQKDVGNLLMKMSGGDITNQVQHEMKIILTRISDSIKKNKKYVVENIKEIES